MICLKIPRRYLIYCFGLFVSLFFTFSFCSSSSFAVSDITFSISDGTYFSNPCPDCYSSGYRYIIVTWDAPSSYVTSSPASLSFRFGNQSSSLQINGNSSFAVYAIHPSVIYSTLSFNASFSNTVLRFSDSLPGDCPVGPSGSITLTENGTYDVTSYSEAVVDVPNQIIQGDYHDDLTTINQSILICGAILLVIYFFYAIYRMIMRGSHGR